MRVAKKHFHRTNRGKIVIFSSLLAIAFSFGLLAIGANVWYQGQLKPVTSESVKIKIDIPEGQLPKTTASTLQDKKIINSSQAFLWYLRNKGLTGKIQAGQYELDSSKSTPEIATALTDGKVSSKLITILPGKRLDQIRQTFIDNGFSANDIDKALDASNYRNHPALVGKPTNQSLEGYLYPESFKIDSSTTPETIIKQSLDQMANALTPDLIENFRSQGLGIHQGVTLASIVEREASKESDKKLIAGVFLNRLKQGMQLQSDPTYHYAAYLLNIAPNNNIDSPYNTYVAPGLPPGPIANMTKSSLQAVGSPAQHQYLYFVAGDDGVTYFAKTLEEHNDLVKQYCKKGCSTF